MSFDKFVKVSVETEYEDFKSMPENEFFIWYYNITIKNDGENPVTLIDRKWKVIDETGYVQEVQGEGVVGEQPTINPGEEYKYTSSVHMRQPSGYMMGSYGMVMSNDEGRISPIDVEIPAFSLDSPFTEASVN